MLTEIISQVQTTEESIHAGSTDWDSTEIPPTHGTTTMNVIITDTLTEQVLTATLLFLCWAFVSSSNSVLIYVIWKTPRFHTPQYMVLVSYMVCDIIYTNNVIPVMFVTVVGDSLTIVPRFVCAGMATIMAGCIFTSTLLIGLVTYERYINFFYPLTYSKYFSVKKLFLINILLHACGQIFSIYVQFVADRRMMATPLACQPTGPALKWANPLVIILFQVPPAAFSIFVLIRLRLLISRHKREVDAMTTNNDNEPGHHVGRNKEQAFSVRKAIKMIALISGSFWFTTIPAMVLRTALFSSEFTWKQSDVRESVLFFGLARFSFCMVILLSSLINPFTYIYVQRDLRKALMRCGRPQTSDDNSFTGTTGTD